MLTFQWVHQIMSLMNLRILGNNALRFIRSPITEIIVSFIIEMSRNYIFALIYQFTGDQLIYTILQYVILFIPWIMLGHGAFRHESQRTNNLYTRLNSHNSSNVPKPKRNLNLWGPLIAAFLIIELLYL